MKNPVDGEKVKGSPLQELDKIENGPHVKVKINANPIKDHEMGSSQVHQCQTQNNG